MWQGRVYIVYIPNSILFYVETITIRMIFPQIKQTFFCEQNHTVVCNSRKCNSLSLLFMTFFINKHNSQLFRRPATYIKFERFGCSLAKTNSIFVISYLWSTILFIDSGSFWAFPLQLDWALKKELKGRVSVAKIHLIASSLSVKCYPKNDSGQISWIYVQSTLQCKLHFDLLLALVCAFCHVRGEQIIMNISAIIIMIKLVCLLSQSTSSVPSYSVSRR